MDDPWQPLKEKKKMREGRRRGKSKEEKMLVNPFSGLPSPVPACTSFSLVPSYTLYMCVLLCMYLAIIVPCLASVFVLVIHIYVNQLLSMSGICLLLAVPCFFGIWLDPLING